jgi:hypothetical protein
MPGFEETINFGISLILHFDVEEVHSDENIQLYKKRQFPMPNEEEKTVYT